MSLRCGITTGACAAAAAKAAAAVLAGGVAPREVELCLPSGESLRVPILYVESRQNPAAATAAVRKDSGDDPDVTDGLEVRVTLSWDAAAEVTFVAGEGVGTVTKPGLQVPPGQPAINPVPRQMIVRAIRNVTSRGVRVEIGVPGGRQVAAKTFNPRLGIAGGLSILGTTGIVRPYCTQALRDALRCTLDVAAACEVTAPVLVPGSIGARAARRHFSLREEQLIEVGNEWGFVLNLLPPRAFAAVLLLGHPGKLAKLAADEWDTHSAPPPRPLVISAGCVRRFSGKPRRTAQPPRAFLPRCAPPQKKTLADELAKRIRAAVMSRMGNRLPVAVFLIDMAGECLGTDGDYSPWQ